MTFFLGFFRRRRRRRKKKEKRREQRRAGCRGYGHGFRGVVSRGWFPGGWFPGGWFHVQSDQDHWMLNTDSIENFRDFAYWEVSECPASASMSALQVVGGVKGCRGVCVWRRKKGGLRGFPGKLIPVKAGLFCPRSSRSCRGFDPARQTGPGTTRTNRGEQRRFLRTGARCWPQDPRKPAMKKKRIIKELFLFRRIRGRSPPGE